MMGQKINALGIRLKKRVNWNVSFSTQDFNCYSVINFKNQQLSQVTHFALTSFQFFPNKITITKTSKCYDVYSKLFQKKDILKKTKNGNNLEFQKNDRIEALANSKILVNSLHLNTNETKFVFSDLFYNKRLHAFKKIARKQFITLAPRIIHSYVANQLKATGALKHATWASNLNLGILVFSYKLLKRLQDSILGLKVVCSGKWKKTRSGRKQRLTIKVGQIVTPGVSNAILYDYCIQKTRYGTLGIKVWIAHKKIGVKH